MTPYFRFLAWILAGLGLVYLGVNLALAQTVHRTPAEILGEGMHRGLLPEWVSVDDWQGFKFAGTRVYGCYEDRETKRRWVSWTSTTKYLSYVFTGTWTFDTETQPRTPADWAVCGWTEPRHVTLGSAYWQLFCASEGHCELLNWERMDRPSNIASADAGLPCGEPVPGEPTGWYTVPSVQKPYEGLAFHALARCHWVNE